VQGRTPPRPESVLQHFHVIGDFDVGKGHSFIDNVSGGERPCKFL
jgi:hypothetical protein